MLEVVAVSRHLAVSINCRGVVEGFAGTRRLCMLRQLGCTAVAMLCLELMYCSFLEARGLFLTGFAA